MNYSGSTSSNLDYSFSYSTGTAMPGVPMYLQKGFDYIPQKPILYRLNMPLPSDQNLEMLPASIADDVQQWSKNFKPYLEDALKRFKELNNGIIFDIHKVIAFLCALNTLCNKIQVQPYIMFNKFSTKVQFSFNENNFVLDYDHEDENSVFILSSLKGTPVIKESSLDKLEETIRSF